MKYGLVSRIGEARFIKVSVILFAAACLTGCVTDSRLQPESGELSIDSDLAQLGYLLFDDSQWGDNNLTLRQNRTNSYLTIALRTNSNFEMLLANPPSSFLGLGRPVGRIDIDFEHGYFTTCTAVVVDSNTVLTSAHCVSDSARNGRVTRVDLVMGFHDQDDESGATRYALKVPPLDQNSTLDYALLESTHNIGQEWGVARLADRVPEAGESLLLIHHPGGAAKHITRGRCNSLTSNSAKAKSFEHSCDSLGGSSGAPLFIASTGEVVAIHNRGSVIRGRDGKGYASLVSDIAESSSLISEVISNQKSAVGTIGVGPDGEIVSKFPNGECLPVDVNPLDDDRFTTYERSLYFEKDSNYFDANVIDKTSEFRKIIVEARSYPSVVGIFIAGYAALDEDGDQEGISQARAWSVTPLFTGAFPDVCSFMSFGAGHWDGDSSDLNEGRQVTIQFIVRKKPDAEPQS